VRESPFGPLVRITPGLTISIDFEALGLDRPLPPKPPRLALSPSSLAPCSSADMSVGDKDGEDKDHAAPSANARTSLPNSFLS
jgi:hypothetical protein